MEFKKIFFSTQQKSFNKYMNFNDNTKKKYHIKIKNSFNFINYILLIYLFDIRFSKNILFFTKFSSLNYIILKVKESGTRKIFSSETSYFNTKYYPDKVYIDGKIQSFVNYSYYFEKSDIYVKLEWNNPIDKCANMFRSCRDINEVDLSNFDTSKIDDMELMFYDCQSITSINLANFDTSQVTSMFSLFNLCTRVTSLNLSKFNTSKVKSMQNMFLNCNTLTSLDLSNFDTSLVETMQWMFEECTKLEYINMKNFNEKNLENTKGMFTNVPNNIIICTNENNYEILSRLEDKNCFRNDCTVDWIINQKK